MNSKLWDTKDYLKFTYFHEMCITKSQAICFKVQARAITQTQKYTQKWCHCF